MPVIKFPTANENKDTVHIVKETVEKIDFMVDLPDVAYLERDTEVITSISELLKIFMTKCRETLSTNAYKMWHNDNIAFVYTQGMLSLETNVSQFLDSIVTSIKNYDSETKPTEETK